MSTDDTIPTGETGERVALGRVAVGVVLVAAFVAAAFARQGLWRPAEGPPVVPSDAGSIVVEPEPDPELHPGPSPDSVSSGPDARGIAGAGPRVTGRPAPAITPPVVTVPRADVPDAATLFGARIVAVSYRAPATVVTRDGARFRAGDALPSGATLAGILRGGLTVIVDGIEMTLDPRRGDSSPEREPAGFPR